MHFIEIIEKETRNVLIINLSEISYIEENQEGLILIWLKGMYKAIIPAISTDSLRVYLLQQHTIRYTKLI